MSEEPCQRINHVAMSVPAALLSKEGCAEIVRFYSEVFGWTEMPGMTKVGEVLILRVHSNEQFVFVVAEEPHMTVGSLDHFGVSVRAPEELDAILGRAEAFQRADSRVRIVERKTEDFKVLALHSFYVGYLLPLLVEVQCYEWAEGLGPDSLPQDG